MGVLLCSIFGQVLYGRYSREKKSGEIVLAAKCNLEENVNPSVQVAEGETSPIFIMHNDEISKNVDRRREALLQSGGAESSSVKPSSPSAETTTTVLNFKPAASSLSAFSWCLIASIAGSFAITCSKLFVGFLADGIAHKTYDISGGVNGHPANDHQTSATGATIDESTCCYVMAGLLICLISFAVTQTVLLNVCLYYYDVLVSIPIYFGLSLVFQNVFGMIFFREYVYYDRENVEGVVCGMLLNIFGLLALSCVPEDDGVPGEGVILNNLKSSSEIDANNFENLNTENSSIPQHRVLTVTEQDALGHFTSTVKSRLSQRYQSLVFDKSKMNPYSAASSAADVSTVASSRTNSHSTANNSTRSSAIYLGGSGQSSQPFSSSKDSVVTTPRDRQIHQHGTQSADNINVDHIVNVSSGELNIPSHVDLHQVTQALAESNSQNLPMRPEDIKDDVMGYTLNYAVDLLRLTNGVATASGQNISRSNSRQSLVSNSRGGSVVVSRSGSFLPSPNTTPNKGVSPTDGGDNTVVNGRRSSKSTSSRRDARESVINAVLPSDADRNDLGRQTPQRKAKFVDGDRNCGYSPPECAVQRGP